MEWTRDKTLLLVEEYNQRPGLWDMSHDDYRKKDIKKELLEEVVEKFDRRVPAVDIEKKFHTLRTQYHREINRMNTSRGPELYKSKWFAFKHLEFLSTPNACRSKDQRRRSSKVLYMPDVKVDNSVQTVHNVQVTVTDREGIERRKDLRVLFEDVVDDDKNDNDEQIVSDEKVITEIQYLPEVTHLHNKNNNSTYEEHLVEEQPETQEVHYVPAEVPLQPSVKTESLKKNHEAYQEIVYEETQDEISPPKRLCKNKGSSVSRGSLFKRDEFSTFGECVANELRFITDRQILISVKHKINTALFEANLAQLERSE